MPFLQKKRIKQIISFSKFSFLAMLANQIIYYSDAFVIGFFLSATAVTYYSIPWSLSEYTKRMCMAISRSYTPAFSERESIGSMDDIRKLYISGTKIMIIVSNLLSIGVIFFGGSLIAIWIGPKYKELCETVLIILFINQFVMGPQLISYSLLQGLSMQKSYSYAAIVVSVLNLSLSVIFIQYWGIVGVAIGASLPQVLFHGIFVPLHVLKKIDLPVLEYLKETYFKSIASSVVLALTLFFISQVFVIDSYFYLGAFSLMGALVYFTVMFFTMLSVDEKRKVIGYIVK
jgi:O-antigen/teichoic acid export membrane protein